MLASNIKISVFILLFIIPLSIYAQEGGENEAVERNVEKIPVSGGEVVDFIIGRGLLMPLDGPRQDSIPMDPSKSGSIFLGLGVNWNITKVFVLKMEPRVTWSKLTYVDDPEKVFPVDSNEINEFERHRAFYLELPVAIKLNIYRNSDDKVKFWIEAGGSFGYNFGSTYKFRSKEDVLPIQITTKVHDIPDINKLRYGVHFRLGTNWIGMHAFYRLSDIFNKDELYEHPSRGGQQVQYPKFSPLEIGIILLL